jgi:predicted  nucleic acid-binding Zn-ribbon protein
MKQTIVAVMVLSVFLLSSCQKSESEIVKEAKLVGNENIQLKKQLTEKDNEIKSLKDEIAQMESDISKMNEEFGQSTVRTLEMIVQFQKRNEALMEENEELKEQLKQLQNL